MRKVPLCCDHNPNIICQYLNTSRMDRTIECKDCPHYKEPDEKGIWATGATPVLAWIVEKLRLIQLKRTKIVQNKEPEMYEQTCNVCGAKFKGNTDSPICPSCYI